MEMSPRKFEAFCLQQIEEFDRVHFGGVACVVGVRLTRFARDYEVMPQVRTTGRYCVTFGMYDSATRIIYLNYHLRHLVNRGYLLRELRGVLYHELIYAVLIVAHQPLRLGLYHCYEDGGHGPEFQRLWNLSGSEFIDMDLNQASLAVFQRMEMGL